MDPSTWQLLGAAGVLAINRVTFLGPPWASWYPRFWTVQVVNLAMTIYLIVWGIPDFRGGTTHVVNLVLAALIVFHSVRNNGRFARERLKHRQVLDDETKARQDAVRARLKDE